jgi:hypothetical protein
MRRSTCPGRPEYASGPRKRLVLSLPATLARRRRTLRRPLRRRELLRPVLLSMTPTPMVLTRQQSGQPRRVAWLPILRLAGRVTRFDVETRSNRGSGACVDAPRADVHVLANLDRFTARMAVERSNWVHAVAFSPRRQLCRPPDAGTNSRSSRPPGGGPDGLGHPNGRLPYLGTLIDISARSSAITQADVADLTSPRESLNPIRDRNVRSVAPMSAASRARACRTGSAWAVPSGEARSLSALTPGKDASKITVPCWVDVLRMRPSLAKTPLTLRACQHRSRPEAEARHVD